MVDVVVQHIESLPSLLGAPQPKAASETAVELPAQSSNVEALRSFVQQERYDLSMTAIVGANLVLLMFEIQLEGYDTGYSLSYPGYIKSYDIWPHYKDMFHVINTAFIAAFTLDVVVRICLLRRSFFASCYNCLDAAVVVAGALEPLAHNIYPMTPVTVRLLKAFRLVRVTRVLRVNKVSESLHLLLKCLWASLVVLFWSLCLLTIFQCMTGMIVNQLVKSYLDDQSIDVDLRQDVFRYYGTFTKSLLTMFEVLFANWAPACRILVENISEWFTLFFLVYRCIIGFAVLNVVNAVFIQQTMKVAQQDQDLAMAQRQMAVTAYSSKLRHFFEKLDSSGDGYLSWDEFSAKMNDPELKTWLSTLDLEHHDVSTLFRMLDNGTGEIAVEDFLAGASRLKGHAKSIDLASVQVVLKRLSKKIDHIGQALSVMPCLEKQASIWDRLIS